MGAQLTRGLAVAAFALAAARPAAGERRPPYGGEVVASLLSEPVALDPVTARSHAELTIVDAVYDRLYEIDDAGRVVPSLALDEPRVEGVEARIALRAHVRFHDGSALGADDVARSLERVRRSGRAGWLLAPIEKVRQDGDEIVIRLRRATPELARLLAAPATSVTPGGHAPGRDRPAGTGPFRVTRVDRGARRQLLLEAWDEHFAGRPYLDRVELRWYEAGDAEARAYEMGRTHVSFRGAVAFAGHRPKHATDDVLGPAAVLVYVGFGQATPEIVGHRGFRRALSLALDRDSLRHVGAGEPVAPAVRPGAPALGGPAPTADERVARIQAATFALERARKDDAPLAAALGRAASLELLIDRSRPDDREIAEKVVAALYRLGIKARITAAPARELDQRIRHGECDLYIGQLAAPIADAALEVAATFAAAGDDWVARSHSTAPLDAGAVVRAFDERLPLVPLLYRAIRAHHRRSLGGVTFDGGARLSLADMFSLE
jgi:peptide/nickel transport system substrate-binding protein